MTDHSNQINHMTGLLAGQVVLVTGAAQGIGLAIAKLALKEGAEVVIADLQEEKGQQVAEKTGAAFVPMDVTDQHSINRAIEAILHVHGRINILVNNAGVTMVEDALSMTPERFAGLLNIDLIGLFAVSRTVAKHMAERKSGSIVNIASISAHMSMFPVPVVAYATAKTAVLGITRNLATEWARYGIRVNSVSPGTVNTELTQNALDEKTLAAMLEEVPMRRLIEPHEVAEAVIFLASAKASAITGADLLIDGGVTLW